MENDYQAFCLDQAIGMLGNSISHELNSVGNDSKTRAREATLQRKIEQRLAVLLNLPETGFEQKYRTPSVS